MLNKKGAEMTIGQLISLILVLVVIVIVLLVIFKPQVWDWVRSLPDYKYDDSDKEINPLEADKTIQLQYFKVAKVLDGKTISFCIKDNCDVLSQSKLYITGDSVKSKIRVVQWDWNDAVGEIVNNEIKIYDEILKEQGSLYDEVKKDLPEHILMINLNGTIYSSGTLYRAKEIENEK